MDALVRTSDARIDALEAAIVELPPANCHTKHTFTPGAYIRETFMGAGSIVTSKIHNSCHPYFVTQGSAEVQIDMDEWVTITAPYSGITQVGTRRVLVILEDMIWCTVHPLPMITGEENLLSDEEKEKIVEKIEEMIIEKHDNLLIHKKESEWKLDQ